MTIVDDRGRLFGRLNLIDAGIFVVVIVLVPLAYVAYALFRPAPMKILSVEPNRVFEGQQPRVRIHGANLRPYLRSQVGSAQPHTFLIESPMDGELQVPALPPGAYDLTLYDEVQEVARLKNAITVIGAPATPQVRLRVAGTFFGLDEASARAIAVGRTFPSDSGAPIEVVAVAAPREDARRVRPLAAAEPVLTVPVPGSWQVPATIRVACVPPVEQRNCMVNGVSMIAGETLALAGGGSFVVEAVHADAPSAAVIARMQFTGRPEIVDLIAAGDIDVSGGAGAAHVVSIRNRQVFSGQVSRQVSLAGVVETTVVPDRIAAVDADVVLTADQTPAGLSYGLAPMKPGAAFTFETARYLVRGTVVSVRPLAGDRSQ